MRVRIDEDQQSERSIRVSAEGRLDALGATRLYEAVAKGLGGQRDSVLLDMEKTGMVTSAGISAIIRVMEEARKRGGELYVFNVPEQAATVFGVVQIGQVVKICEDEDSAREMLGEA